MRRIGLIVSRVALLIALTVGIFVGSVALDAQQGKVWRLGLFHVGLDHVPPSLQGLRDGLKALGYVEGKNIHLDFRNLPDEAAARAIAQEFVRDRVDLIVAFENQTVRAAKAATSEIPVLMLHIDDPVAAGYVKSLARPGGNLTGFAGFGNVPSKEMELFKELVPELRRVLVLTDPGDPGSGRMLEEVQRASAKLKLRQVTRAAAEEAQIARVFGAINPGDVDGVFLASPNLRVKFHSLILRLASEKHLPVAGHRKEWVERGALFSYNDNIYAIGRAAAARYADRILKGKKPADLPVEEVTQYELVINLKVAKALGLTIPRSLLIRADEIIR